jgi:hypothetical protein
LHRTDGTDDEQHERRRHDLPGRRCLARQVGASHSTG